MQQMIFIADLIACSTCFGHHYVHHLLHLVGILFRNIKEDALSK